MMFKIRISHTTHASLASNINLTHQLYLDPPTVKFVLDYAYMYGGIKAEGVRHLVTWDITTIITGAQIVMIKDDIIYEVTKNIDKESGNMCYQRLEKFATVQLIKSIL